MCKNGKEIPIDGTPYFMCGVTNYLNACIYVYWCSKDGEYKHTTKCNECKNFKVS